MPSAWPSRLVAALLLATGPAASAQPPRVAADVDLVLVDVVVTDLEGRPVPGLGREEFRVREDDAPQGIVRFEAVEAGEARPPSTPAGTLRVSTNVGAEAAAARTFVLLFDDLHLGALEALAAREAAARFLAQDTQPGDRVTLVVPGAGLRWTASMPAGQEQLASLLGSIEGRRPASPDAVSDFEALRIVEDGDRARADVVRRRLQVAGTLPEDDLMSAANSGAGGRSLEAVHEDQGRLVEAEARRVLDEARRRRNALLEVATSTLDALALVPGRKSVLLLSGGFVHEPDERRFREVVAASRRANAAVYFLDAHRLFSGGGADGRTDGQTSDGSRSRRPEETQGADAVAEETGGLVLRNTNDLGEGLARISRESAVYYLVGYSPTRPRRDGGYRRIGVEVDRPGVRVRARPGYYAPSASGARPAKPGEDRELDLALAAPASVGDLPLRLGAFVREPVAGGNTRVTLASEVGVGRLQFERAGDSALTATLDVAMELSFLRPATRRVTPWREWKVTIPADARGREAWVPLEMTVELPAGVTQARLAVRDRGSRAIGTVVHAFDVPAPGAWRVSTPILGEVPAPDRAGLRLGAARSFAAGTSLYCYFRVHNAEPDPVAAQPRVTFAYSLRDGDGKVRRAGSPAALTPGEQGRLERVLEIPLAGLAPGDYSLGLTLRDEVSGRKEELAEPFSVRRPPRLNLGLYTDLVRAFRQGDAPGAVSGLMQWPAPQVAGVATALESEDLRRAALALHTDVAILMWQSGRPDDADAQVAVGRALVERAGPPELHRDWLLTLGYYHEAHAAVGKALSFFTECVRLHPDSADAWLGAGTAYEATAFPDGFGEAQVSVAASVARAEAERSYREALRLDPGLAEAHLRLGRVLRRTGALEDAERELAAAAESGGEAYLTALAHLFWGELREARGDLGAALGHYETALAADPGCQPAALARSSALHASGRPREAAEALVPALAGAGAARGSPWRQYHLGLGRRYQPALAGLHADLAAVAETP